MISPSVSKPRKSTRITLTTLVPPPSRIGVLEEKARDAVGQRPRHHRIGERRQARRRAATAMTQSRTRRHAARVRARAASVLLDALGQPAQAEQNQHRGHDLDDELGQREVGSREPDESDAGDQPRTAEQNERGQAMKLGLLGGADGAGDPTARPARRPGRTRCR